MRNNPFTTKKWKNINEVAPLPFESVLFYTRNDVMFVGAICADKKRIHVSKGEGTSINITDIVYWRPLPKTPKTL